METTLLGLLCYLSLAMCCCCATQVQTIELPRYIVIESESDFEIRLYNESSWMSASVPGTSFEQSTKSGFHRLYQYIHGANLNFSKLEFTAPVLTSIPSSSNGDGYTVRIYVSTRFQGKPPQPNPELKLQVEKWKTQCIAVRKFTGFARDDNINKEIEALGNSLKKHLPASSAAIEVKRSYAIAQYNASFYNTGRLNEVWIDVSGLTAEGCSPSQ